MAAAAIANVSSGCTSIANIAKSSRKTKQHEIE